MNSNMITLILLGIMLLIGGIVYLNSKNSPPKKKNTNKPSKETSSKAAKKSMENRKQKAESGREYKENQAANIAKDDVFKFMEFDKIQDNMIIQKNGEKYTAVIKCKGINYNLMSEVEQLSVEEGFINFLNTLKFPIQLYVQAQNIDLNDNIKKYKDNMRELYEAYDDVNLQYSALVNSLDSTDEEIEAAENERNSILNVLEYGKDIMKYVERLSLNKSLLQRNFYVLVSYYKSEITNASNFSKEESLDICYSELFTRVQSVISGLSMSSVSCDILDSNEIAELIFSAYNRDDKNYFSVKQALDAGFHRLYSTSKDAIAKKHEKLIKSIKEEAEYKAVAALAKAIENDEVSMMQDIEDEYDQASSKQAIEIIKKEKIDDEIKNKAKKIIIEEYKEAKKERMEDKERELEEMKKQYELQATEVEQKAENDIKNTVEETDN